MSDDQRNLSALQLGYEFSIVEDAVKEYGDGGDAVEALAKIELAFTRMRAALEDVAAGRREFDLTPRGQEFDFVSSFWFLVKIAEGVVGDA